MPGQPTPEPVRIPDGIKAAEPCADSVWVLTNRGEIVDVVDGRSLELGAWQGAGRYVVAVDPATGKVAVLDPRTSRQLTVQLKIKQDAKLHAPVTLGSSYVFSLGQRHILIEARRCSTAPNGT